MSWMNNEWIGSPEPIYLPHQGEDVLVYMGGGKSIVGTVLGTNNNHYVIKIKNRKGAELEIRSEVAKVPEGYINYP